METPTFAERCGRAECCACEEPGPVGVRWGFPGATARGKITDDEISIVDGQVYVPAFRTIPRIDAAVQSLHTFLRVIGRNEPAILVVGEIFPGHRKTRAALAGGFIEAQIANISGGGVRVSGHVCPFEASVGVERGIPVLECAVDKDFVVVLLRGRQGWGARQTGRDECEAEKIRRSIVIHGCILMVAFDRVPYPNHDVNGSTGPWVRRIPITAPVVVARVVNCMPLDLDRVMGSSSSRHAAIKKIMLSRVMAMNSISCCAAVARRLPVSAGRPIWSPIPGERGWT